MTSPVQRSFAGGELSPQLYGHVDQQKYASGLRTCRNMVVGRYGGVLNRPGLQFIAEIESNSCKLIPFVFNQKAGETFLIVINETKISFIQNGGQVVQPSVTITGISQTYPAIVFAPAHGYTTGDEVVISGVVGMTQVNGRNFNIIVIDAAHFTLRAVQIIHSDIDSTSYSAYVSGGVANRVYKIASPWNGFDHSLIQYAQTGDVVTIVHPDVRPYELQRIAALNWQVVAIVFRSSLPAPTWVSASGGTAATQNQYYIVTAVSPSGDETEVDFANGMSMLGVTLTVANPAILTVNTVAGAAFYRWYKRPANTGIYGFIGQAASAGGTVVFTDYGIFPDFLNAAPIAGPLYNVGVNDYPSTVGFVQQRRGFGNSKNNPTTVWLSKSGSFANFSYHNVGTQPDDDPITFVPANEHVNSIEHILELRQMLVLTSGAELAVNGNAAGTVTPTAVSPQAQSYFGSGILKPITFGDVCLFQQARGWFVRDLGYAFEVNGYRGNDITIFSTHLFEGFTLENWTYQQIPNSVAWMVRNDGQFLGLTYVREQQILAWHRHDTASGTVLDIVAVPETPEDSVYCLVRRTIGGLVHFYIERMANFYWSSITSLALMDSWLQFTAETSSFSNFVSGITGGTTWDYDETLTMTFSSAYSKNVGDQIWLTSPSTGQQIRFTITAITGGGVYSVRSNRIVPVDLRGAGVFRFSAPIQTITNLWTLEGLTVSVFADGFVVGSPNNNQIENRYTVTNGQIVLDKPYAQIFVGIPITYDVESLDMDTAAGDSIQDTKKHISRVSAYVTRTRGVFAGPRNPDTDPLNTTGDYLYGMTERKPDALDTYDDTWPLESKPIYINIESNWNRNGRVFIRQVDPVPLQIVTLVPEGKVATNSQNLRV